MGKFTLDHPGELLEAGSWDEGTAFIDPSEATTSATFIAVVLTLIFACIFITASLLNTIFLIIFFRKPSLRNISNRFIVSLNISNLVTTWVLLPLVVADIFIKRWAMSQSTTLSTYMQMYTSSKALCTTFNVAADFATSASVFSTLLIAFDRFFAITDPLHYHMLVTKSRSWLFIGLGWMMAVMVATFSGLVGDGDGKWYVCEVRSDPLADFYYWSHMTFAIACFVLCFALPLFMLSWAYAKIYAAAQQNSERARRSSLCSPTLEVIDNTKSVSRSSSTRSTSSQIVSTIRRRISNASLFLYKEEARAAKISVAVVILFMICWFPYYLTKIIYATFAEGTVKLYIFKIVLISTLFNAAVSPYVYMFRSKCIQREVMRLFGISTKAKRGEFERRRPIYHQLSANLEKIPASPICLEGNFKLECSQISENFPVSSKKDPFSKLFRNKIFHPNWKKSSLVLPSTCISPTSPSSTSSTASGSYNTSNLSSSSQTLHNFLPINMPMV